MIIDDDEIFDQEKITNCLKESSGQGSVWI